jgi:ribonuclease P protein component
MRARTAFTATVRGGVRSAVPALVVHLDATPEEASAQVGFIVSRAVGGAVVRNRVRRRLRHLMRERLDLLPPGGRLVVRVNPSAVARSSTELVADLDRALDRALTQRMSR